MAETGIYVRDQLLLKFIMKMILAGGDVLHENEDQKKTYVALIVPDSRTSAMIERTENMTFFGSHFSTKDG